MLLFRLAFVSPAIGKRVTGPAIMIVTVTIWMFNMSQALHSALYLGSSISSSPDRGTMEVPFRGLGNEEVSGANSDPVSHSVGIRAGVETQAT